MYCNNCGKPIEDGKTCDCQNQQIDNVVAPTAKCGPAKKIWMGILSLIGAPIAIAGFIFAIVFIVALALASIGNGDVSTLKIMVTVCFIFFGIGVIMSNLFGILSTVQFVKCKKRGLGNPIVTFILGVAGMVICDIGCMLLLIYGINQ